MPGAYLFGWDDDNKKWVKVLVNNEGKLIIDPSEIFEEDPTDGEVGKAPTSNWAHDHAADASAHHGRYTDAEARAAIGNIFDETGMVLKTFNYNFYDINNVRILNSRYKRGNTRLIQAFQYNDTNIIRVRTWVVDEGEAVAGIELYDGSAYRPVATEPVVDSKISDHASDAQAHHVRYTDEEARAAIGGVIDSSGKLARHLDCGCNDLMYVRIMRLRYSPGNAKRIQMWQDGDSGRMLVGCYEEGVGYVATDLRVYDGSVYRVMATQAYVNDKISAHTADASAHHARYTDEEARAACGVDGDLYWSVPGVGFSARYPDTDSVKKAETGQLLAQGDNIVVSAPVCLPHGATVKAAVVTGNASAVAGETWELRRYGLDGGSMELLASAGIGTEDTSIANAVIDNENYSYCLVTSSLDNGDEIYGARITYTI